MKSACLSGPDDVMRGLKRKLPFTYVFYTYVFYTYVFYTHIFYTYVFYTYMYFEEVLLSQLICTFLHKLMQAGRTFWLRQDIEFWLNLRSWCYKNPQKPYLRKNPDDFEFHQVPKSEKIVRLQFFDEYTSQNLNLCSELLFLYCSVAAF